MANKRRTAIIDLTSSDSDSAATVILTTTTISTAKRSKSSTTTTTATAVKAVHPMFTATTVVATSSSSAAAARLPAALFKWHSNLGSPATCLHGTYLTPTCSTKIAAYDIDGCLIKTKPPFHTFPKDKDDWVIWKDTAVVARLQRAHAEGFAIVLLSNQCYKGKKLEDFKQKIPLVARTLNIPFHVFAATAKDKYRKPDIGMFKAYVDQFNEGKLIDYEISFFVGDAAGRPRDPATGRAKDHASTDLEMAANAGLHFETPEEHFL